MSQWAWAGGSSTVGQPGVYGTLGTPAPGNIPGGRVEPFESLSAAGARELREETGLDIAVGDQLCVFEIISPPFEHRVIVYSWGTIEGGTPQPGSDLDELRFFSREELATADLTPAVREVLQVAGWLDHDICVSA